MVLDGACGGRRAGMRGGNDATPKNGSWESSIRKIENKRKYLSYRREYIKYFRCDRRQKSHLSLYPVDMVLP